MFVCYNFSPLFFENITIFRKDSVGSPSTVNSRVVHGNSMLAKLETKGNLRAQNYPNLWHRFYLLNFAPTLDSFKKFSMDTKFRDCIVHWSIAVLKIFKGNLLTSFDLIAVFVKVFFFCLKVYHMQKELSVLFYPDSYISCFSKSRKSTCFLRFGECIRDICWKNEW